MAKRFRSITQFLNGIEVTKGTDIASATSIAPGKGVFFDITGTTTTNYIKKPRSGKGQLLVLRFNGNVTVTHNGGAAPAGYAAMKLVGAGNVSATAADVLILLYDGSAWQQIAPTLVG